MNWMRFSAFCSPWLWVVSCNLTRGSQQWVWLDPALQHLKCWKGKVGTAYSICPWQSWWMMLAFLFELPRTTKARYNKEFCQNDKVNISISILLPGYFLLFSKGKDHVNSFLPRSKFHCVSRNVVSIKLYSRQLRRPPIDILQKTVIWGKCL